MCVSATFDHLKVIYSAQWTYDRSLYLIVDFVNVVGR